jgi:hypothetical protein
MKLNFCTLFNINYLAKGVALYDSLIKTCPDFHLYIFAFDDLSYEVLRGENLSNATIIPLADFENERLLAVKANRSKAEYCYTCTPFTAKYCIETFALDHCTYIDADIYFYTDPTGLIVNMGDNSVLITPHNYHSLYDQSAISGIYCVQFVCFKNTADGMKVLNWWADACIKWCYSAYEDGKMGDQKYLDSWPYMFDGVYICRAPGAGMAPWNALGFDLKEKNNRLMIGDKPLYFYHFHGLIYLSNQKWYIGGYVIPAATMAYVYKPYIKHLLEIDKEVRSRFEHADALNTIDVKKVDMITLKYKVGIYVIDIKKSFRKFFSDLFFNERRKHYRSNYIKID